jgi:hypothetical protein
MAYKIEPLDEFSSDPKVYALLKLFGDGRLNQRAAQAAAWHLANNMSWDELAAKHVDRIGLPPDPYFTPEELQAAIGIVNSAVTLANELPPKKPREKAKSGESVGVPAKRDQK